MHLESSRAVRVVVVASLGSKWMRDYQSPVINLVIKLRSCVAVFLGALRGWDFSHDER